MEAYAPPGSGDKILLSVSSFDAAEGERLSGALAARGTVTMLYAKQFRRASFGQFVDRFGIEWMVNAGG